MQKVLPNVSNSFMLFLNTKYTFQSVFRTYLWSWKFLLLFIMFLRFILYIFNSIDMGTVWECCRVAVRVFPHTPHGTVRALLRHTALQTFIGLLYHVAVVTLFSSFVFPCFGASLACMYPLWETNICQPLRSIGVTRFQHYYELIRLLVSRQVVSSFHP